MSIIDQQKELEYYPDEVLAQEMMQPTGIAPSFLVATEIKRRNDMRNSYQMQMNQPPQMSVAEEQAMELQGIPNIDPNMMQQQMMQDPMMQEQMPQNAPMQMREGGDIGRYQEGETVYFGEDGIIFDPNDPVDVALLGLSAIPIGGRAATAIGLGGKALATGAKAGLGSLRKRILQKLGEREAGKKGFTGSGPYAFRNPATGRMEGSAKLGEDVLKRAGQYFNPRPLNLSNPFYSRTVPAVSGAGFIGTRGGDDVDASIGGSAEASTEEVITQNNNQSLQDTMQQIRDEEEANRLLEEGLETGTETEAGKMLADAMANVPEDTTFQEYLDALQGMEATRQSQILMDLGAAIANASHGGDIAKGLQEAGTKARTEQLNIAKERARVIGESRARDIDIGLKISNIDAALRKSDQITLSGWLDLFADNPELIDAIRDADDPVNEIITILDRLGVNTENMKRAKDNQDKNE
jgi:hypothetical protein